jgi:hypothetical protein
MFYSLDRSLYLNIALDIHIIKYSELLKTYIKKSHEIF